MANNFAMKEEKRPEDVVINIKPDDCIISWDITFEINNPKEEKK